MNVADVINNKNDELPSMLYMYKRFNDKDVTLETLLKKSSKRSYGVWYKRYMRVIQDCYEETSYKRVLQIVNDCTVYMSNPGSFNDPFDCCASTLNTMKEDVYEVVKKQNPSLLQFVSDLSKEQLNDLLSTVVENIRNTIGVCCMTP